MDDRNGNPLTHKIMITDDNIFLDLNLKVGASLQDRLVTDL